MATIDIFHRRTALAARQSHDILTPLAVPKHFAVEHGHMKETNADRTTGFPHSIVRRTGATQSQSQRTAQESCSRRSGSGGTPEVLVRRAANQSDYGVHQRSRRPTAHARL